MRSRGPRIAEGATPSFASSFLSITHLTSSTHTHTLDKHLMIKIWSLKKDEETARKRKPKTSPAQLRVQKGECRSSMLLSSSILTLEHTLQT